MSAVRALWRAIGDMSQQTALIVGSVVATWTFAAFLLAGIIALPATFNDWVISVVTLSIDFVLIMVGQINTRLASASSRDILGLLQAVPRVQAGLEEVADAVRALHADRRAEVRRIEAVLRTMRAELDLIAQHFEEGDHGRRGEGAHHDPDDHGDAH